MPTNPRVRLEVLSHAAVAIARSEAPSPALFWFCRTATVCTRLEEPSRPRTEIRVVCDRSPVTQRFALGRGVC
jgi:hypothetical protein